MYMVWIIIIFVIGQFYKCCQFPLIYCLIILIIIVKHFEPYIFYLHIRLLHVGNSFFFFNFNPPPKKENTLMFYIFWYFCPQYSLKPLNIYLFMYISNKWIISPTLISVFIVFLKRALSPMASQNYYILKCALFSNVINRYLFNRMI